MKRVGAQATAGGSQLLCRCSFLRETSVASPGSKVICRRRTENETHRAGGYPGWLDSVCVDVCGARCTRDRRNGRGRDSKRSSCAERDARSNSRSRLRELLLASRSAQLLRLESLPRPFRRSRVHRAPHTSTQTESSHPG